MKLTQFPLFLTTTLSAAALLPTFREFNCITVTDVEHEQRYKSKKKTIHRLERLKGPVIISRWQQQH